MTEGSDPAKRASDEDRKAVADRLREALDDGRLNVDEYDERLRSTYSAVTTDDLAPITQDLPEVDRSERSSLVSSLDKNPKLKKELRDWASVAVLLTIVWGVLSYLNGKMGFFWPIIPIGIWGAIILVSSMSKSGSNEKG